VANAVIFQNVVDISRVLGQLKAEGYAVRREDIAAMSPYLTQHIKRFGDYFIDLSEPPQPLAESALFEFEESITSGQCPIFTRLCRVLDNAEGYSGRPSISFFSQQLPVINDLKRSA